MASKRLIPLLDRVLVRKVAAPEQSIGGILLPESAAKLNEGIVIAVGAGRRDKDGNLIPNDVKEGDTVLLPEYGGTAVQIDHEKLSVFRQEDIIGVLTQ
mmetsp:Transcript_16836/g.50282  ORF Transcript_16836/g.50282 Transcript_16836/m.50282 type:complete len:99 (-) Transcript_16836:349-645(-)|eukprot:CAMPEP_0206143228 /NCGR_PEP_ID=MMETSP1473-20131121/19760_1 /ASSEMBLY_ACC=CAM_ASM_001109 /TAXON_ID=1461547 /ORGANISM="Stichococcus sp, Strain RCC1054" /LENGTH=98 /DNA_ID=CAMNT_0053538543 /DNA_START=113 /DNA_END=409 /DNA_ORIENTATION=+